MRLLGLLIIYFSRSCGGGFVFAIVDFLDSTPALLSLDTLRSLHSSFNQINQTMVFLDQNTHPFARSIRRML